MGCEVGSAAALLIGESEGVARVGSGSAAVRRVAKRGVHITHARRAPTLLGIACHTGQALGVKPRWIGPLVRDVGLVRAMALRLSLDISSFRLFSGRK